MRAPFLIIETGRPVAPMRRHGGFPHWIRVAAGLAAHEVRVADAGAGAPLPDPRRFAGVLVTGSAAMVTDRHDWSERSAEWLREAAEHGVPLFGICYGHQLLAHALGGEVGDNPRGREMGTAWIEPTPEAARDPLFSGLPERFPAQTTHLQSVLRLPQGATVLARNDHDPHHAFRWKDHVWGVQFHPEFGTVHMRGYIRARAGALAREGTCPRALAASVSAAPHARRVLRRFVRIARSVAAGVR